jgi:hypothetical protein
MAITQAEARQKILDDLGAATERVAFAVACLGVAYEQLSVGPADRLEAELYRPAQKAYGRGKRTRSQFAQRTGFEVEELETPSPGLKSQGVKSFVEKAVVSAANGDRMIAALQDTMLPVESGDAELRAGLSEVRKLLAVLPGNAREFLRTLGR